MWYNGYITMLRKFTNTELKILKYIFDLTEGGRSLNSFMQKDLCEALDMQKSNMSVTINNLIDRGVISRQQVPKEFVVTKSETKYGLNIDSLPGDVISQLKEFTESDEE